VNDYGFKGVDPVCPTYESVTFDDGKATVRFKVDKMGLSPMRTQLGGFEIAGADKVFHEAKAKLAKDKTCVEVWCEDVPEPVAVRYCFHNWSVGTVFNNYGIPVAPFRTDDWSREEVK
jgi:sialate O-acetylesterase